MANMNIMLAFNGIILIAFSLGVLIEKMVMIDYGYIPMIIGAMLVVASTVCVEKEKKCSCNELEYTNQYADSWKCKRCKKIYLNKERDNLIAMSGEERVGMSGASIGVVNYG